MENKKIALTGWESTYRILEPILKDKSDYIILLIHYLLIYKREFQCLGIGEDVSIITYINTTIYDNCLAKCLI